MDGQSRVLGTAQEGLGQALGQSTFEVIRYRSESVKPKPVNARPKRAPGRGQSPFTRVYGTRPGRISCTTSGPWIMIGCGMTFHTPPLVKQRANAPASS